MPVANLLNIPNNSETWSEYSFSLQATLRDINEAIYRDKGIALPIYPLDPFNILQSAGQLYYLQTMMDNINQVLGLAGFDLVDVDLTKTADIPGWIWNVFTNIKQAADILGVG